MHRTLQAILEEDTFSEDPLLLTKHLLITFLHKKKFNLGKLEENG